MLDSDGKIGNSLSILNRNPSLGLVWISFRSFISIKDENSIDNTELLQSTLECFSSELCEALRRVPDECCEVAQSFAAKGK